MSLPERMSVAGVAVAIAIFAIDATPAFRSGEAAPSAGTPVSSGLQPLILYSSYRGRLEAVNVTPDKLPDLFVVAPDGRQASRVTRTLAWETEAAWSPDGRRIAYARGDNPSVHGGSFQGAGATSIWVANADGTRAHRLPGIPSRGREGEELFNSTPVWSPNGRTIAFTRSRIADDTVGGVYATAANGGSIRRLVSGGFWGRPAWSPDGGNLAAIGFQIGREGVYIIRVRKSLIRRLIPGAWSAVDWSPDGKSIATVGGRRMRMIEIATGRITDVSLVAAGASVEYSPDGQSLAVGTDRGLYLFASREGRTSRLVARGRQVSGVSWSPTGRKIAFTAEGLRDSDVFVVERDGRGLQRLTSEGHDAVAAWRP